MHKTLNVLDKLPKNQQPQAERMLHEIWMAATRADATKAFERFIEVYQARWPRACECLEKDRAELLAFYDFPAEHWGHLRTSNPIESTFATVRLRTYRTKGAGSREAGLAMAFKLARKAESRWRKLNGSAKLQDLIDGLVFVDGERIAVNLSRPSTAFGNSSHPTVVHRSSDAGVERRIRELTSGCS